ncbi:hypothetical protein [Marinimicrobium alkaliphilum]|uniref:hypothetical protein n=1 Tax=Marinimicrobium alkaliphilum TaxID=2202654 RepID=UPI000DBA8F54|nr:hypothetical protein [Marinimicrobium alkaliphilum]
MTILRQARRALARVLLPALALGVALPTAAQEVELCSGMRPCRVAQPVTVGEQTTLSLIWRGRVQQVERFADVASDVGYFTLGDHGSEESLGAVQRPLSERVMASPDGQVILSINETLTVPADVSRRAAERGHSTLSFVRRFSINGMAITSVQTIRLSTPAPGPEPEPAPMRTNPNAMRSLPEGQEVTASGLLVRRVALRFEDGSPVASVARDEPLRAQAHIHYDRAGLLEAVWELATPATTGGQPVYRRLDNVRQYLGAGQQATLQSPVLPVEEAGLYLLRLRLIQPRFEQDTLDLRYQVSSRSTEPARVPVLRVSAPAAGAPLRADTRFQWRPVAQTRAYQLELYERPPTATNTDTQREPHTAAAEMTEAPTTGMLLPGNTESTQLSPAALQRLAPGRTYYWRIVAVNADGAIVAASPVQPIQTEE